MRAVNSTDHEKTGQERKSLESS